MPSKCPSGPAGIACQIGNLPNTVAGHAVSSGASSVLHDIAESMASAAAGLLKTMTSVWMQVDAPPLTGASSPATTIMDGTRWITVSVAVVCILVAAARMAIRRRGEPGSAMALGLARLVFVSAVATFLVQVAGQAGDELSSALVHSASVGTNTWSTVISVTGVSAAFAPGDGVLLTVAVVIVVATLIQLLMMVMRVGLLIVLTGTLPLAAAASMSDWGENWWRKHLGWLAAWLAYKPAAAVLFASAMVLTHMKHSFVEVAAGFMILILMVFLLPALLRLIAPMTASLGAASGGALALGAAGAVATGAARLGGIDGIRSMLSGLGGDGPSGNSGTSGTGSDGADGPAAGDSPPGADGTAGGLQRLVPDSPSPESEDSSSERISGGSSSSEDPGPSETTVSGQIEDSWFPEPGGTDSPVPGSGAPGSADDGAPPERPASGARPGDPDSPAADMTPPDHDDGSSSPPPGASGAAGDEPPEIGG